ncbi:MAG: hypothetical protein HQL13_05125 [Candidatus Omnitrophica bacterium]|nr:hypothetical protein [Candidatus Omnitrophota bacterium]
MMEQKDAMNNGELQTFNKNGLEGGVGRVGKQLFNTNVLGINRPVLAKVLQRIFDEILLSQFKEDHDRALEEFNRIIAPELIAGGKAEYQLEGPIGTVFINLHNWIEAHPAAKAIVQEETGNGRLLTIVSTTFQQRNRFFTPIKAITDWLLQGYGDYYTLDEKEWVLRSKKKENGETVPLPEIDQPSEKYSAFKNVKKALMAIAGLRVDGQRVDITNKRVDFVDGGATADGKKLTHVKIDGTVYSLERKANSSESKVKYAEIDRFFVLGNEEHDVKPLKLLQLDGDENTGLVLFPGAYLGGNVKIANLTPHVVNLYNFPNNRFLNRRIDGRLVLENVSIKITEQGGNFLVDVQEYKGNGSNGNGSNGSKAMAGNVDALRGGIDLALDNIEMDIDEDGEQGTRFNIPDAAMLTKTDFGGLVPLIVRESAMSAREVQAFLQ